MKSCSEVADPVPAPGPQLGEQERAAVERVLSSGMLAQGPEVAAFEAEFAEYVDGRPCVAVSSGTSALLLGLLAAGIGPGRRGDRAVLQLRRDRERHRARGRPAGVRRHRAGPFLHRPGCGARRHHPAHRSHHAGASVRPTRRDGPPGGNRREVGLALVEDAAQAHLAALDDKAVGTFGAVAAFSFYPTKNMTTGEGGLVVCADESIARQVRLLRNQGMEQRYQNELVGYNARMSDLHAAIGRVQLRRLPGWSAARRRNAEFLTGALENVGQLRLPRVGPGARPVWHQYTVRAPRRDQLVATLAALGVPAGVYYPTPIHRLPRIRPRSRPAAHRGGGQRGAVVTGAARAVASPARPSCLCRRTSHRTSPRTSRRTGDCPVNELRAGLVGLGMMGRNHARVLKALDGVRLVAAADPRIEAKDPVTGVEVLRTVRELIERGIDMCVVATPTATHDRIGLELAEAGVATLVEKPLAHDVKAAQTIVEAFARNRVPGCVGHIERFNPALQDMRRRLDLGELGEIYQVVTRRQGAVPGTCRARRRCRARPGHPRHRPHGVADSLLLSLGQRADGAPQRPNARGSGERGRRAHQRHRGHPPGELAVPAQGADHRGDRRARLFRRGHDHG